MSCIYDKLLKQTQIQNTSKNNNASHATVSTSLRRPSPRTKTAFARFQTFCLVVNTKGYSKYSKQTKIKTQAKTILRVIRRYQNRCGDRRMQKKLFLLVVRVLCRFSIRRLSTATQIQNTSQNELDIHATVSTSLWGRRMKRNCLLVLRCSSAFVAASLMRKTVGSKPKSKHRPRTILTVTRRCQNRFEGRRMEKQTVFASVFQLLFRL